MKVYNSYHNFYRDDPNNKDFSYNLKNHNADNEISSIEVIKNEEFGFFVSLNVKEESCLNIGKNIDLPWWGLKRRYRLEVSSEPDFISPSLVEYVRDDDGTEVADIISDKKSNIYPSGEIPVFIQGKIPEEFSGDKVTVNIKLFKNEDYKIEELIEECSIDINIIDYTLNENFFFLDLWQHPCSWARVYNLEYFSDEHFTVIGNYLAELSKLGQKVINLVVSDFPWAGQKCFDVKENPSRLYEYNIIKVSKKNSKLSLDFSYLDKYVDMCFKLGINEEINLFGLIGNWHGYDFGSPLEDYQDSIRIRFYDEDKELFDYLRTKNEISEYIKILFEHFKKKDYLKMTKIIGDEPSSVETFEKYSNFLNSCTTEKLSYKYAIHTPGFFETYNDNLESFSINTLLIADYYTDKNSVYEKFKNNSNKMTWYSCCFPDTFNIFIKSPLIESRLIGFYTYLLNMKGMLRWAYGLYVEDVFSDITYKKEKWAAGDMLFVYPGKNMKPIHSLREKNILYSIQDFNIFKKIEEKYPSLSDKIKEVFSITDLITTADNGFKKDIKLDSYPDITEYKKFRNESIKNWLL